MHFTSASGQVACPTQRCTVYQSCQVTLRRGSAAGRQARLPNVETSRWVLCPAVDCAGSQGRGWAECAGRWSRWYEAKPAWEGGPRACLSSGQTNCSSPSLGRHVAADDSLKCPTRKLNMAGGGCRGQSSCGGAFKTACPDWAWVGSSPALPPAFGLTACVALAPGWAESRKFLGCTETLESCRASELQTRHHPPQNQKHHHHRIQWPPSCARESRSVGRQFCHVVSHLDPQLTRLQLSWRSPSLSRRRRSRPRPLPSLPRSLRSAKVGDNPSIRGSRVVLTVVSPIQPLKKPPPSPPRSRSRARMPPPARRPPPPPRRRPPPPPRSRP